MSGLCSRFHFSIWLPPRELKSELTAVFRQALTTAAFIGGPMVEGFEREFAAFCDTELLRRCRQRHGRVAVCARWRRASRGRRGRHGPEHVHRDDRSDHPGGRHPGIRGRRRADLQHGSREAARSISRRSATQTPGTGKRVSRRTGRPVTAVVPVHLYGQMADMDAILEVAERYGLIVVEDACQAHGAEYFSKRHNALEKAGSMGSAAAFSFYPGKNLGACGEAGAVTTNDQEVARKIADASRSWAGEEVLPRHRRIQRPTGCHPGRHSAGQAAASGAVERRSAGNARLFMEESGSSGRRAVLPVEPSWSRAVYHLYVIRTADRHGLQSHLGEQKIGAAIHYPIPLHLQKAYEHLGYREGDFPISEGAAKQILSLPMYPQLRADQQERVGEAVAEFLESKLAAAATGSF